MGGQVVLAQGKGTRHTTPIQQGHQALHSVLGASMANGVRAFDHGVLDLVQDGIVDVEVQLVGADDTIAPVQEVADCYVRWSASTSPCIPRACCPPEPSATNRCLHPPRLVRFRVASSKVSQRGDNITKPLEA